MTACPYDLVLFDLGGVLVEVHGVADMRRLSGINDEDELWRRWLTCEWVRRYERGQCSREDFAAGLVQDWSLGVTPEAFLECFASWPRALYEGAVEPVEDVRGRARVGCLSNTNELHWVTQSTAWGLAELFELHFLSHQLQMVKPDAEVFAEVVTRTSVPPERTLFLDDNEINVQAAIAAEFAAARVRGPLEARGALVDRGVLPD